MYASTVYHWLERSCDIVANLHDYSNQFYNIIENPDSDWNHGDAMPDQYPAAYENQRSLLYILRIP